jgi:hypothetical protein
MSEHPTDPAMQDLNLRTLMVAAALLALGTVLGMTGFAVAASALVAAGRRWYRRADLPPHHLARLKWEQAKAAAGAGSTAWRDTEQEKYHPRSRASSMT